MTEIRDVVILSNAPGELTTWVYPFVQALQEQPDFPTRVSVVLSPCTHASGNEAAVARSYAGVARVLPPDRFWDFLLWGKTPSWDWLPQGVVVFLGGDQFYTLAIGRRLGYRTVIYAEWEARWVPWIDGFALRHRQQLRSISSQYHKKAVVIGDLMTSVAATGSAITDKPYIVFLPGSKAMKLQQGVPLCLGVADRLRAQYPELEFYIALAPTLTPETLGTFAASGAAVECMAGSSGVLIATERGPALQTSRGTTVHIYETFPAHRLFVGAQLCITTVGANTAQLAALGVPMVVLLPTNQWDAMGAWDGFAGLLGNLPGIGRFLLTTINQWVAQRLQQQGKLLAWPNIWAGRAIVPEYLGHMTSAWVADKVIALLEDPQQLAVIGQNLRDLLQDRDATPSQVKLVELVRSVFS